MILVNDNNDPTQCQLMFYIKSTLKTPIPSIIIVKRRYSRSAERTKGADKVTRAETCTQLKHM